MKPTKKLYFIEANISAGKTTLLKNCQKSGIEIREEPLHVWKEEYVDDDGTNILGLFYNDMARWSFQFELTAFTTRIRELQKALMSNADVVVVERSILVDYHVFAPNLREEGKMKNVEWKIYEDWFKLGVEFILDSLLKHVEVEFIYIDTDPRVCWERKMKRDRKEEKPMPYEYMQKLDKKMESWLFDPDFPYPLHKVNGNLSEEEVFKQVQNIVNSK